MIVVHIYILYYVNIQQVPKKKHTLQYSTFNEHELSGLYL